jgi:hypothetical protein
MALKPITVDRSSLRVQSQLVDIAEDVYMALVLTQLATGRQPTSHSCALERSGYSIMFPNMHKHSDGVLDKTIPKGTPVLAIVTVFHYGQLNAELIRELESLKPGLSKVFTA